MKQEIWLRSNVRVAAALALVPTLVLAAGVVAAASGSGWLRGAGLVGSLVSVIALAALARRARRPRLAYRPGELVVYLTGSQPVCVPIELVECFFLGQGPSLLPVPGGGSGPETATMIVRLAESARDWSHREVPPRCGHWCEGYITIRGTCCERLDGNLVARLNRRLVEIHRERRGQGKPH